MRPFTGFLIGLCVLCASAPLRLFGQVPPLPPTESNVTFVTVVSNAPVWHNPRQLAWDGYTNACLELYSCTNLRAGQWIKKQTIPFPTNTWIDATNPAEFYQLRVKVTLNNGNTLTSP